jgi:hypothetical protein
MEKTRMCSYLHRRNGVYYTRLVVPQRLRSIVQRSDLGRSLGTKELAEAKRLLPSWLEDAQAIIAAAERELAESRDKAKVVSGPLTQEEAEWQEENARFWLQFEWEDEAKAEGCGRAPRTFHPSR